MKLESISLVNVCQHEDTRVTFDYGVTGVFGHNGCGKSNLLNMAKVSLTGDFSVNPGVKADNIRHGVGKAPAFIAATWSHAGTTFDVVRGLQESETTLKVHGRSGSAVRGVTEVNAAVEAILGLPKQVIDGFIFVDQWKMFEFMSAKPADRAKTFAHLCNTFAAERLWRLLSNEAAKHRLIDYSDEILQLKSALEETQAQIAQTAEQIIKHRGRLLSAGKGADLLRVFQSFIEKQRIAKQIAQKRGVSEATTAALTKATVLRDKLHKQFNDLNEELLELNRRSSTLNVAHYAKQTNLAAALKLLQEQRTKLLSQSIEPKVPKAPAMTEDGCRQALAESQAASATAERYLALITTEGISTCPTCLSEIDVTPDLVDAQRDLVSLLKKEQTKLRDTLAVISAYKLAVTQNAKAQDKRQHDLASLEKQIELISAQIDDNWAPSADCEEEMRSLTIRLEAATGEHRQLKEQLDRQSTICSELAGAASVSSQEWKSLSRQYAKLLVTKAQASKARDKLNLHKKAQRDLAVLNERATSLEQRRKETSSRLVLLESKQLQEARRAVWLTDVATWRDIVHRDNLPRLMANSLLERLTHEINRNLEDFSNPFNVAASDDLSFVVNKPYGRKEQASRLSGGEKILLAVAFRFAVNSVFAADAGMLVLDEPSAGLDTSNIDCFADVIERIAAATEARQQQIIIVTHDERLHRAIPAAINLPEYMRKREV